MMAMAKRQQKFWKPVNYDASVGALDKKADEYARLTAADKFTCSESYISFIGQTWNVPEGEAPASSEYQS